MMCDAVVINVANLKLFYLATGRRLSTIMNQGTSYQIVSEDALSSGMEDDDSSSEHQGSYEEHYRQEAEPATCNSHSNTTIGEIQRGWTYEDQFKEVYM